MDCSCPADQTSRYSGHLRVYIAVLPPGALQSSPLLLLLVFPSLTLGCTCTYTGADEPLLAQALLVSGAPSRPPLYG